MESSRSFTVSMCKTLLIGSCIAAQASGPLGRLAEGVHGHAEQQCGRIGTASTCSVVWLDYSGCFRSVSAPSSLLKTCIVPVILRITARHYGGCDGDDQRGNAPRIG
eukprot:628540-Pleurochrysis_carterae.AAC.1